MFQKCVSNFSVRKIYKMLDICCYFSLLLFFLCKNLKKTKKVISLYLATAATQLSNTRNQSEPRCSTRHWHQISHESLLCVGEGSSPLHRQSEQPMWHSSIWKANPAPFPLLLLLQLPPQAVHSYCNSHVRSLCTCIRRGWHWWWWWWW